MVRRTDPTTTVTVTDTDTIQMPTPADDSRDTDSQEQQATDPERLLERFGAERIDESTLRRFPDPVSPPLRRGVFFAGRDLGRFLEAATSGDPVSVVTGVGPSGPMHLGHVLPFYLARYLQDRFDARVYVPVSDDEKYWAGRGSLEALRTHARENLRDVLAVGFDPELTRVVLDLDDADVVYPAATAFAGALTPATVRATYGEPDTVGTGFYPAVQTAHLLLPQLVHGAHETVVPVGADQDPHIRVSRDVAAKDRYPVSKPAALLARSLPGLGGPGKMSSSGGEQIRLTDDRATVESKLADAYSGGRASLAAHREHGGDPSVDVAYRYLEAFFEPDDGTLERLATEYRAGELLTGELKAHATTRIADFLAAHQARRPTGDLASALAPYRLTDAERRRVRERVLGVEQVA